MLQGLEQGLSARWGQQAGTSLLRSNETRQSWWANGLWPSPTSCLAAVSLSIGISSGMCWGRTNNSVGVHRKLPPRARERHGTTHARGGLRIHVGDLPSKPGGQETPWYAWRRHKHPPPWQRTQLARFDLFIHLRFSVCSLNAPGPCFSRLFSFSFVVTATATREFEKLRAGEDEFALRRWLESFADPTGASRSEDSCPPSMGPWAWVNFPVATCPPERSSPSVKLSPTKQ